MTVTDANGCNSTSSVSLTDPAGMASAAGVTSSYNGADISCFGATDGELTASVSGGTPGYSFLWSDGQTNAIASGLSDGSYTVTITDQSGCTTVSTASVNQPTQLSLNSTSTPTLCNGDANGSVIAAAGGGTGTYTYNIGAGNQASSTFTGLSAGNYTVSVTDVNGCLATSTVTVTQPTALTASVIDNGNGSATANASGGTSPYSYLWDANTGSQTTQTATGLTDGTYSVTITDANGCQTDTSILIVVSAIVDDIIVEKFEVYPNPNNGAFTLTYN